jgi:hypothetical protein
MRGVCCELEDSRLQVSLNNSLLLSMVIVIERCSTVFSQECEKRVVNARGEGLFEECDGGWVSGGGSAGLDAALYGGSG